MTLFNNNSIKYLRSQPITKRVLFITTYTALHVSAYRQAIFRCYVTYAQQDAKPENKDFI
jgi:hypothetical protein